MILLVKIVNTVISVMINIMVIQDVMPQKVVIIFILMINLIVTNAKKDILIIHMVNAFHALLKLIIVRNAIIMNQ